MTNIIHLLVLNIVGNFVAITSLCPLLKPYYSKQNALHNKYIKMLWDYGSDLSNQATRVI